jgi:hypothetical protein
MTRRHATLVVLLVASAAMAQPPVLGPGVRVGVQNGGQRGGPPNVIQPPAQPPFPAPVFASVFTNMLVVVAILIAQKQKLQREEEEEVSTSADRTEFEYKFLRSQFGAFKKPERLRAALAEEARAGWELVEKFDDNRLRLRRPVSCRAADADRDQDPYRTLAPGDGAAVGRVLLIVLVVVLVILGGVLAVVLLAR